MENVPIRDGTATRPNAEKFDNPPNSMMANFGIR